MKFKGNSWIAHTVALVLLTCATGAAADTDKLVSDNAAKVVQVEIFNQQTDQNQSYGSGFFINDSGLLATNFHVVSRNINYPEEYAVRLVDSEQNSIDAEVVAIDIVNDLALLKTNLENTVFLELANQPPNKGAELYSMGNPHNLGMVVTQGNYNGLVEHRSLDRVNLTGSLNPGMSGGPTIDAKSRVIGINVTTRGNQIGALVPVDKLRTLIQSYVDGNRQPDFSSISTQQLKQHQHKLYEAVVNSKWPEQKLGNASVIGKIAEYLNCGSSSNNNDDKRTHDSTLSNCYESKQIYVNRSSRILGYRYSFRLIESDELNSHQLARLYEVAAKAKRNRMRMSSRDVSNFHCDQSIVSNNHDSKIKVMMCTRAYRKHEGLFDLQLSAVLLGEAQKAVVAKLYLNAIGQQHAKAFSEKFLENIKWN